MFIATTQKVVLSPGEECSFEIEKDFLKELPADRLGLLVGSTGELNSLQQELPLRG